MASYFFYGPYAQAITGTTGTFTGDVTVGGNLAVTGTSAFTGASTFTGQALGANGTAVAPSFAFTNATGTGLYRPSANALGLSTNGTLALTLSSAQLGTAVGAWQFPAGTGALPGVSVGGTADGMFQVSSGIVGLGGAGTEVARFSATLAQIPAASVITWLGQTKLSSPANGTLVITNNAASGSVAMLRFDSADNNGSKIRNNGGGIINIEDGAATGIAAQVRTGQYFNNNGTYGMFFNTSATFGNGGNSATTTLGLGTASLTAMSIGSTQNISIYGTGGFSGTNSGSATNIKSVSANTTLSTGGTTTTIVQIPAGAIVLAVTARVTTTITASLSTSWSLTAGTVTYATGKALTSGTTVTSTDYQATFTGPTFYAAATNLVVTMNTDAATAGVVRAVVHYYDTTAPTA